MKKSYLLPWPVTFFLVGVLSDIETVELVAVLVDIPDKLLSLLPAARVGLRESPYQLNFPFYI
jgi:hypothetical protein